MSDLLIEIGEEMTRRFGLDVEFWMKYVMEGYYIPKDIRQHFGEDLFKKEEINETLA